MIPFTHPLALLRSRFAAAGDQPALIWRGEERSYAWLLGQLDTWGRWLDEQGVGPGAVVALETDYAPMAVALLLALIERAAVVVPLAPAAARQAPRFKEIAQVEAVVRCRDAQDWLAESTGRTANHPLLLELRRRRHPGLILFSSGSTGDSKAAVHDFERLLAKFQRPRPALRAVAFLLFDHIGGLNTLFYALSNGATLVVAEDRGPDAIAELIARHRVELLPTTPTFLNLLLLAEVARRFDLSSLRLITYGTEPMPESTLRRMHELLPATRLAQTYGLSELGILRAKSKASDSLLVKIGGDGYETRVVDGILWIRAESAMLGYLNAPSPFDAEGWFNTGDRVETDGEYLRILGRDSDVINVGGEKVFPAEVESVLLQVPGVVDATVRGEANSLTGQTVVAELTLEQPEELVTLRSRVRQYCRERLAAYKVPTKVLLAERSRVTDRFKKERKQR